MKRASEGLEMRVSAGSAIAAPTSFGLHRVIRAGTRRGYLHLRMRMEIRSIFATDPWLNRAVFGGIIIQEIQIP